MCLMSHRRCTLNSNLILLIPESVSKYLAVYTCFKFQSDSINTNLRTGQSDRYNHFKFQSDSINTRKTHIHHSGTTDFKFQSDSINTRVQRHL